MNVFITGATGVLGQAVLPLLIKRGLRVRGLSRSTENTLRLKHLGVEAVSTNLFDPIALREAVQGSEAVLHLATKIAPIAKVRYRSAWAENDRIRTEGTKNLVDTALAAGAKIVVYPSVVFVYPDSGDQWITSDAPTKAIGFLESTMAAEREIARFGHHGARGLTLRMGLFYGPESSQTQELIQAARLGIAFIPGPAHSYIPAIWVQDAASAVVEAMERAPSGTYNVVDDEPLTRAELTRAIARAVGRRNLIRLPMWLTHMIVGRDMTTVLARSQRVSNRHFKEVTGWSPAVKNAWEGWALLGANNQRSVRSAHV